jgi:hypothetical protein
MVVHRIAYRADSFNKTGIVFENRVANLITTYHFDSNNRLALI